MPSPKILRLLAPALLACLACLAVSAPVTAQTAPPRYSKVRPVTTYSIVARDPETGDFGVAVQSHWFSVGALVPWAEAGVGAVATQSMVDPSYGSRGLALMKSGVGVGAALEQLLQADQSADIRQVAMVGVDGAVAAHTGARCIDYAGHQVGPGFSVQANLMENPTVPQAMASAYEAAHGPLAERLLAALAAAEREGGDIRGRQSAALLVVKATASGDKWQDVLVDLRVEDNPDPVTELARLLQLHRGYEMMNAGDLAIEEGNLRGADHFCGEAENILADNPEARFWHAVALVNAGKADEALPLFGRLFLADENWRTLTPRLVKAGFLEADDETLARILTVIPVRP
jgi:uncharacterized Ntn-hydrolase superfamily protein